MTSGNKNAKRAARQIQSDTGMPYMEALRSTHGKAKRTPLGIDKTVLHNARMKPEILESYLPFLNQIDARWHLSASNEHQMNLDTYSIEGTDPDWDNQTTFCGVIGGTDYDEMLEEAEDEGYVISDKSMLDDVWSIPHNLKLTDCAWLYVGQVPDFDRVFPDTFPKTQPPFGEWIDGLNPDDDGFDGSPALAIKLVNDGPDFVEKAIKLLNWVASQIPAPAKASE